MTQLPPTNSSPASPGSTGSSGASRSSKYLRLIIPLLLIFGGLGFRFWVLQVRRGEVYHRASSENVIRTRTQSSPRGRIFDRTGVALAENRPSYSVYLLPTVLDNHNVDRVLDRLQGILNLSRKHLSKLRKKIETRHQAVEVEDDIPRAEVARLETHRHHLPGLDIRVYHRRHYPMQRVGAHTVGYLSMSTENSGSGLSGDYDTFSGKRGLEAAFDSVLQGSPGITRKLVDARGIEQKGLGAELILGGHRDVEPIAGRDLQTTLDAELMLTASEAMEEYPSGAAVAVDPTNGDVLALYSKPGFNPNAWSGKLTSVEKLRADNHPFKPMLDKTISAYFPGSTFKPMGAIAALEKGVISRFTEKWCPGDFKLGGRRYRCWKSVGHGDLNVIGALRESCDVFFYQLAETLGMDPVAKYARRFGFGQKTGLVVGSEGAGRVPTEKWHEKHSPYGYVPGFSLSMIIGQGNVQATPLQIAMAYAAIGNGGRLYRPRLISQIRTQGGQTLFEYPPTLKRKIDVSDKTLQIVQRGLEEVVNASTGTAYSKRLDNIKVSGKTGTAQVHTIGQVRIPNKDKTVRLRDHAWFAAYAPSDDPEIAVAVFLEHGGHGGAEAAPVAMKMIDEYLRGDERSLLDVKTDSPAQ